MRLIYLLFSFSQLIPFFTALVNTIELFIFVKEKTLEYIVFFSYLSGAGKLAWVMQWQFIYRKSAICNSATVYITVMRAWVCIRSRKRSSSSSISTLGRSTDVVEGIEYVAAHKRLQVTPIDRTDFTRHEYTKITILTSMRTEKITILFFSSFVSRLCTDNPGD